MDDLSTQLREYLDATSPAVEAEDILAAPTGDGPVRPLQPRITPRVFAGSAYAVAAAFAVLVLVGGLAWLLRVDPTTPPATPAPSAAPTTIADSTTAPTTTPPGFATADARSVALAYFAAYNEGDVDAVVALFEPDATFSTDLGSFDRAEWEQLLVWNAAQGTFLSPPSCLLAEEIVGVSVRLVCSHDNVEALVQAVDSPAVPIRLTLVITPDGIVDWKSQIDNLSEVGERGPDFNEAGIPFSEWMMTHHPDIAASVGFGNWASVEEAERNGILTAQYAAEWAAYLDANGCAYDDGC